MEPAQLQYAPPVASRAKFAVIPAGLLTTAIALFGVWYSGHGKNSENIMGWYADYVIPVGAIIVGLIAGIGYGIGSYFSGFRPSKSTLLLIFILQIGAYGAAQYLEFSSQHLVYRSTGKPLSFIEYYHLETISIAWEKRSEDRHPDFNNTGIPHNDDDDRGEPLGMWGYGLRALEIFGFSIGAAIILGGLMAQPYCQLCQVYMKKRKLPTLPASVNARKVKKNDVEGQAAYNAEQQQAIDGGSALLNQMSAAASTGDVDMFNKIVEAARPSSKRAEKLPRRISVKLVYCKNCLSGHLAPAIVTGQRKAIKRMPLQNVPTPEVFVSQVIGATARP